MHCERARERERPNGECIERDLSRVHTKIKMLMRRSYTYSAKCRESSDWHTTQLQWDWLLRFFFSVAVRNLLALYSIQIAVVKRLFFLYSELPQNFNEPLLWSARPRSFRSLFLSPSQFFLFLSFRVVQTISCCAVDSFQRNVIWFDSHTFCTLLSRETNFPFYCPVSMKCFHSSSTSAYSSFIIPKYRCFFPTFFFYIE